jgi:hypothetical protein
MILLAATISGFKSFRKPVEIFFSPRTSVLIGPNDHGKTNVLLAIDKLGADKEFSQKDVNDRLRGEQTAHITYRFQVSEAEIHAIESGIKPLLEQEIDSERERFSKLNATDGPDSIDRPQGGSLQSLGSLASGPRIGPLKQWWTSAQSSRHIEFVREVGKPLDLRNDVLPDAARAALASFCRETAGNDFGEVALRDRLPPSFHS